MGYDPFSPIAPALLNVLCVPAGRIAATQFTKCLEWLRKNAASIPISSGTERNGSTNGETPQAIEHRVDSPLLLSFGQHGDADALQSDIFFEPNRRPQLVLGLIDGKNLPLNDSDAAQQLLKAARSGLEQYASQLMSNRVSTNLVVFDPPSDLESEDIVLLNSSETVAASCKGLGWLSSTVTSALNQALDGLQTEEVVLPALAARFDRLNGAQAQRESSNQDGRRQSTASSSSRTTTTNQIPNSIAEESTQAPNTGLIVSSAILMLQQGASLRALERFTEGARAARDAGFLAWHAKALEGILVCMILLAWSGAKFQIPQDCYPISKGFSSSGAVHSIADANRAVSEKFVGGSTNRLQALTAMLPGLLATIMNLYDRAVAGYGDAFPRLLVCEARVRLAAMLIILKKHDGVLGPATLEEFVSFRKTPESQPRLETPTVPLSLRSASLSNLLIESILEAQVDLPVQSASSIYLVACKYFSELKLDRKQGFYMKDVLQRLPPVLVEARKIGLAEAQERSGTNAKTLATVDDKQHEMTSRGVRGLLRLAVKCYNPPSISTESPAEDSEDVQARVRQRLSAWVSTFATGDIATKLEMIRLCIRVSDALPDPVGSLHYMALLLHISRQSVLIVPGPANPVPLISTEEQNRLINGIQSASALVVKSSKQKAYANYWDDFLVRGITVSEHPSAGKLMPHTSKDLSLTSASGTNRKDPFIYNPFSGSGSATGPVVLVKHEIASFEIVLQNALEVELEVESISLITEGCDFEASKHSVVLGPLCVQVFTMKGVAKESGTLKITGCRARIKNCREQDFAIFSGPWKPPQFAKRKDAISGSNVQLPATTILELSIVEPLPSLVLDATSLVQRSVMLMDGEKRNFTIDLRNTSDLEADLVLFSYEDSVSRQLQEALTTKDLQPAENYELQTQLTTKPAIKRVSGSDDTKSGNTTPKVGPHSTTTFEFSILGKPGLAEAVILIDYAYIGKPRNEIEGTFHTRQLRFAVNITVGGSVDIPRCNILSIPPSAYKAALDTVDSVSTTNNTGDNSPSPATESCLLQLDLRSLSQSPVRITVEKQQISSTTVTANENPTPPTWEPATTLTLLPGHIDRTLVLIPKIYIPDPFTPIPSLSPNRQFVVSASKLSLEAELTSREMFWYREKLCGMIRIKWEEEHGRRKGDIDVRRGIRLNSRMIDALRVEHVQVSFDLRPVHTADQDAVKRNGASSFDLKRNVFANVVVNITNWTQEDLKLLLRLQPSLHNQPHSLAMDLSKKFVWSGVLQRVFKGSLKAGGSVDAELGIVALVASTYEINATVEEVRARKRGGSGGSGGDGTRVEDVGLSAIGEMAERRIWHARRPCLITVGQDEDEGDE